MTGTVALPLIESCRIIFQRAAQTLKWVTKENWLLDIALDHLTLSRAALYAAILEGGDGALRRPRTVPARNPAALSSRAGSSQRDDPTWNEFETARRELDVAVSGLRQASTQHMIPFGLLTRAWLRFLTGARTDPDSAQEDLDEAWEIAERGSMKLHMADIHLYRARLFGRPRAEGTGQKSEVSEEEYPWESPAADLAAAEKLINDCGYHRRDEELADAKAALKEWEQR